MKKTIDKFALLLFDFIAAIKGYRFVKVATEKEFNEANDIYNEEGFSFPEDLEDDVKKYKAGTINFIAYYRNEPVGMVRLADPRIINRAWEHYGVDKDGLHHEIQSLVVRKEYRDGPQFVMLGLVKKLYVYSIGQSIRSWSACGKTNVYMTMRRYCKKTAVIDIDFKSINHPVTQYLYANNIVETYFTMEVASFVPWEILKKYIKKTVKKWDIPGFIKERIAGAAILKSLSIQKN